jgi:putative ABC transport system permease protein
VQGNLFPSTWTTWVTPGFFDTFKFAPLAGRGFSTQDDFGAPAVAIVSESFARSAWPQGDPIGRRIKVNPSFANAPWATVVGIVPDTLQGEFDDNSEPESIYLPLAQGRTSFLSFAVRTQNDPYEYADAVREAVREVDADLPIYWLRSLEDWLDIALWDARLMARLFGVFAAFALLLAMSGIYAVLAYAVSQRTREIGVRRALGAPDQGILRMVLGQGSVQLALGLGLGRCWRWRSVACSRTSCSKCRVSIRSPLWCRHDSRPGVGTGRVGARAPRTAGAAHGRAALRMNRGIPLH